MAVTLAQSCSTLPPYKRQRRTATSVLAGVFDPRPPRDVLTSLLNGVPINKDVEETDQARREKRREKKERDKEKKKAKALAKPRESPAPAVVQAVPTVGPITPTNNAPHRTILPLPEPSSLWGARPVVHLATIQRSVSVTPPPMPESSPPTTPGPSISSSTSRTSSKRPHTPYEDDDLNNAQSIAFNSPEPRPRKKRAAARKGWKGWVEGSPPPSEKLINLDAVTVLHERRTRSGKNFDAIGLGQDGWV
ncbi:hypothetical protein EW146_g3286 [Bondarzewia mesenterica]|uniref:Uncharacterized protein n=1 Tax=Bondarzewia mesenterica TaxID=1095465 RepID=A0A4S4LY23_9AGAM|nr:hypothetical protein EW146_g3286 [Bondarzewia mesenterica]